MKDLITEARELHAGWMAHESIHHGGGQGAKSDDGEMSRKFMLWLVDDFPELCDALEKAQEQNKQLMHEVCKLTCESVEREKALAKLEAEVMAACNSVRWIPVTERLPEPETNVLICQHYHEDAPYAKITIGHLHQDRDLRHKPYWNWIAHGADMVHPKIEAYHRAEFICPGKEFITHWMPLPAAPEEGAEHE